MDIGSNLIHTGTPSLRGILNMSQVLIFLILLLILPFTVVNFCNFFVYLLVVGILDDLNDTVLMTHLTLKL